MTVDEICTQTRFTRDEAEIIAPELEGRAPLERFFWSFVSLGYSAIEVRDGLRALSHNAERG